MAARSFGRKGAALASAALAGLLMLGAIVPLAQVYPFGLEYYNCLVGGPPGARKLGLETTYWWTALNREGLERVNRAIPSGESLNIFPMLEDQTRLYKEIGMLRPDIRLTGGQDFKYILLLSRPYPGYPAYFAFFRLTPAQLRIVAEQDLEGVPLWVLYERMPAPTG